MKYLTLIAVTLLAVLSCSRDVGSLYVPLKEEEKHVDPNSATIFKNDTYLLKSLTSNPIDIVWVVDNSGSMSDDIQNMKTNMHLFMAEFEKLKGANWKMGLVSSAYNQNPFLGFSADFNYQTANPAMTFNNALDVLVKQGSSVSEQTCRPLVTHFANFSNFIRKDAMLAIIIVTDEDEQSYNGECMKLVNDIKAWKGDMKKALMYGIFGAYDMNCGSSGSFNYNNSNYQNLVNNFPNQKLFSLCSNQFGKDLTKIGNDIVAHFEKRRIVLPDLAVPESIHVFHRGVELKGGLDGHWVYYPEPNAVYFNNLDFAVGDNEQVQVKYEVRKVVTKP